MLPGNPYYPPGFNQGEFNAYYSDVPEVPCRCCDTYFEQHDPDERYCEDCKRVCQTCGEKYASPFPDQHWCDRCGNLPDEPPNPNPQQPE